VKIVIADPNDLFRCLLRNWLKSEKGIQVVGETDDGNEVVELVARSKADILVMDPAMPHLSGLTIARQIHATMPQVRLVALYDSNKPYVVDHVQKAGFQGCLCKKTSSPDNLRVALNSVMDGNAYFCAETCRVQNAIHNSTHSFSRLLSLREQDILRQIGYGKDNEEIAAILNLSPSTVQTHRRNLFRKLGIHDTPALMSYAFEQGFCLMDSEEIYSNEVR
jgi:DNA-binding NarL/FixJ family response regulator